MPPVDPSQFDASSAVLSVLLLVINVCVFVGLVLVVRWSIRRLRKLLLEGTGPWRWVGIILLGSVALVIGLYLGVVAVGFLSLAIG